MVLVGLGRVLVGIPVRRLDSETILPLAEAALRVSRGPSPALPIRTPGRRIVRRVSPPTGPNLAAAPEHVARHSQHRTSYATFWPLLHSCTLR